MNGEIARLMVGQPYGSFFGWKTNGIFQNWSEINAYVNSTGGLIQPNAKPGDFKWVDNDGDGQITDKDQSIFRKLFTKIYLWSELKLRV